MKVLQQSHKFYIQHCQAGVIPSVCGQIYAFKFAAGYFRSVAVHFIGPTEIKRKLVDTTAFSSDSAGSWCVVFGYRTLSPQTRISVRTFFSPPGQKTMGVVIFLHRVKYTIRLEQTIHPKLDARFTGNAFQRFHLLFETHMGFRPTEQQKTMKPVLVSSMVFLFL